MIDPEKLKEGLLDLEGEYENPNQFEPVSDALKKQEQERDILMVKGLKKVFGPKTAVDGVNLKMYNGQIYALLGHNGAGKTTTISMLTGLLEPTAGQAEVFGRELPLNETVFYYKGENLAIFTWKGATIEIEDHKPSSIIFDQRNNSSFGFMQNPMRELVNLNHILE